MNLKVKKNNFQTFRDYPSINKSELKNIKATRNIETLVFSITAPTNKKLIITRFSNSRSTTFAQILIIKKQNISIWQEVIDGGFGIADFLKLSQTKTIILNPNEKLELFVIPTLNSIVSPYLTNISYLEFNV